MRKPLIEMGQLKIFIIMLVLLGQSCSGTDGQFKNIVNSPDKFHDQEVEITGVIHGQFTDSVVYLTNGNEQSKAIRVNFSDMFMLLNTFNGLDGKKIRIKGRFNKNDKGLLGQFAGSVDKAII